MSLKQSPRLGKTPARASRETVRKSSWISELQNTVRSAALTVMLAVSSVTGATMVASMAGCTFDRSGLPMPNDAGPDADADADVPNDADADADVDADVIQIEICNNGIDDNGNWAIDCDDPDCTGDPACTPDPEICGNSIDDDGDNLTDCDDPDCAGDPACTPDPEICDNSIDDDGDGDIDCNDFDCAGTPACTTEICDNELDDDGDGDGDCADPDCADFSTFDITCAYGQKWETDCTNGIDDNGDGDGDCADPYCATLAVCGAVQEICGDGLDNTADGLIDCVDGACTLDPRCNNDRYASVPAGGPGTFCNTGDADPDCTSGRKAELSGVCMPVDTTPASGCYNN